MVELAWRLYSAYSVEQNKNGEEVIRGHGWAMEYYPMAYPRLPFELVRVDFGDKDTALNFVHKWGMLGYEILLPESERTAAYGWYNDDPLEFIWCQGYTVRHVLTLYEALCHDDSGELANAMTAIAEPTQFPQYGDEVPDHVRKAAWWAAGEDVALFYPLHWVPDMGYWGMDIKKFAPPGYGPEEAAAETIATFISGNLSGIQPMVHLRDPVWRTGQQGSSASPHSRLSPTMRAMPWYKLSGGIWQIS
jgi:hypothetical protein